MNVSQELNFYFILGERSNDDILAFGRKPSFWKIFRNVGTGCRKRDVAGTSCRRWTGSNFYYLIFLNIFFSVCYYLAFFIFFRIALQQFSIQRRDSNPRPRVPSALTTRPVFLILFENNFLKCQDKTAMKYDNLK